MEVGNPYPQLPFGEGVSIGFAPSGITIIFSYSNPTKEEIKAISSGSAFEIRSMVRDGCLWIFLKCGSMPWAEAPYLPYEDISRYLEPIEDDRSGYALMLYMVDADDIHESQNNINCIIYTDGKTTVSRAVIFCHGFGGHKGNGAAKRFANYVLSKYKGLAVICFDWPCHGDDVKKKLCLADCDDYLDDVIRFAREELGAQELYLYATSFGGYLSLRYLSLHGNPFTKIALRCPAVNMYEVLTTAIMTDENRKLLERGKEAQVGFDRKILINNAFLNELKAEDIMGKDFLAYADDILILHGTKDEIVPISAVTAFSENNVIEMIPIENADHRFIDAGKMTEAIQHIERFFAF